MLGATCAFAADDDDWKAARKASCTELKEAYRNTLAAERKVADAIKASTNGTVATNVLGATAFAFTGFFFSPGTTTRALRKISLIYATICTSSRPWRRKRNANCPDTAPESTRQLRVAH